MVYYVCLSVVVLLVCVQQAQQVQHHQPTVHKVYSTCLKDVVTVFERGVSSEKVLSVCMYTASCKILLESLSDLCLP